MESSVRDFGDAVLASTTRALSMLAAAIPRIIGFVIILAVGWGIAAILARGFGALLRAAKFDHLAQRSGFTNVIQRMGIRSGASAFIGLLAKWFVRLITLVVAFDALGVPSVSDVLRRLLLWLPNLAVALVILVIAGVVGNAVASVVRGALARAGVARPNVLAAVVRSAVLVFGVLVALNQVGVASSLVNILFIAMVGAAALALGLGFGLGARDTAARIVSGWYETAQRTMPALASQVDDAYARSQAEQPPPIRVEVPGAWTGAERRHGANPQYRGVERRRGMA